MKPRLRCRRSELKLLSERYAYALDDRVLLDLKPTIASRGWMTKDELRKVARWKALRCAGHIERNPEEYVEEITEFAFSACTERARIESLRCLSGVDWPTASTIMHFFHREAYPILDFRALWSASLDAISDHSFNVWWLYVEFCRDLSHRTGLSMRALDRALWQYSKENQQP